MSIHKGKSPRNQIKRKGKVKLRTRLDALTYALKIWEAIDTPTSLSCAILLRSGEHEQLVRKTIAPSSYQTPRSFFLDYQSVKLLSKYPYLKTGIDTEAVAREKFYEAEKQCRDTNRRFRRMQVEPLQQAQHERVLHATRAKIASILGDVPDLSKLDFSFGPGAAYGVRGETSVYNKVSATLECTYAFTDKLQEFLEEFPGWFPEGNHDVVLVQGSQLTFVPKDAKTDRPICIEPLLNGLYQKGFGTYIRQRLARHGVDLKDQSINQRLASSAHAERLATVDFASASDTIAYLVVMDLLPFPWFEALDVARCPRYEDGKMWRNFHKFSSMGNAYTFELESLIFYALAYACVEESGIRPMTGVNLSVYGDDVIIPQQAFDLFQEITEICGFTVSQEKSFTEGPFFESCGHDFFNGSFVRPFLIKKRLNPLLQSFYAVNTVQRLAERLPKGTDLHDPELDRDDGVVDRLRGVHSWCINSIPRPLRTFGPEGFGDGHIVASIDASRPTRHPANPSWDGWCVRSYVEAPIRVKLEEWPTAYALYNTRTQGAAPAAHLGWDTITIDNGNGYSVRGRTRLQKQLLFVPFSHEWTNSVPAFGREIAE